MKTLRFLKSSISQVLRWRIDIRYVFLALQSYIRSGYLPA